MAVNILMKANYLQSSFLGYALQVTPFSLAPAEVLFFHPTEH